jgi:hypothetical protein
MATDQEVGRPNPTLYQCARAAEVWWKLLFAFFNNQMWKERWSGMFETI